MRHAEIPQQLREAPTILGEVDRIGRRAENRDAGIEQRQRQLQRRLPAELDDAGHLAACLALSLDDRHDVLERQRLEVQTIGRVVVGRDRFGVAVHHHRLEPFLAEAEDGVEAAVVELDALADAVGAAPEDDDLLLRRRLRLVDLLVRAVHVRRERLELGRARIDPLERGHQALFDSPLPHELFVDAEDAGDVGIGKPTALQRAQQVGGHLAELAQARHLAQLDDVVELLEEPGIDLRQLVQRLDGPAAIERAEDRPHPPIGRDDELLPQRRLVFLASRPA